METMGFDFEISECLTRSITEMGYETPTPVQQQAIPALLAGRDVIAQAQTGTGKTAAFGIPMVERIDSTDRRVQAIVLSPTRELAVQTATELLKLARYKTGVRSLPVYGGQPIERQLRALQLGVQIVVGTPGRVMDHMRRGTLDLSSIRFVVLDEADEMLDMGFRDDMEEILSHTPAERQTALFSATLPFSILSLANRYLRDPETIRIEPKQMTVEAIRQTYITVRPFQKSELLARLLLRDEVEKGLVFVNTKRGAEEVVTSLKSRGFSADALHGDMRQLERDAIMARYRQGLINILVATDVAARGLDIDGIDVVFNYDVPQDVEYYVHRIGRTGRAGREGRAYTFISGTELSRMWEYRKITGAKILCEKAPTGEEMRIAREEKLIRDADAVEPGEDALNAARKMLESKEPEQALAALIEMSVKSGCQIDPKIDLVIPEPPKPVRPAVPPRSAIPARPAKGAAPLWKPHQTGKTPWNAQNSRAPRRPDTAPTTPTAPKKGALPTHTRAKPAFQNRAPKLDT